MWALNELTNDEAPANVTVYKILGKKNKSMLSVPLSLFSQRSHQPDGGCVLTYLITRLVLKWKIIPQNDTDTMSRLICEHIYFSNLHIFSGRLWPNSYFPKKWPLLDQYLLCWWYIASLNTRMLSGV